MEDFYLPRQPPPLLLPHFSLLSSFNATPLNTLHCLFTRNKTPLRHIQHQTRNIRRQVTDCYATRPSSPVINTSQASKDAVLDFKAAHATIFENVVPQRRLTQ
jgi:hypothetical protein